jgi:CheY-like chemotaxis protein
MDLGLPDLSGVEVIKVIRCYEQDNKRVPIVVLTAYVEEKIINACLAAGADSVFYKPIEPGKLAEIVWKYCH